MRSDKSNLDKNTASYRLPASFLTLDVDSLRGHDSGIGSFAHIRFAPISKAIFKQPESTHLNMSTNFGTLESDDVFPEYCSTGKEAKKSLSFTKKSLDATKNSSKQSEQTESEDVFSPDQTDAILHDLRTFARKDWLKITNCIFRSDHVEICYLNDGCSAHNKDELRQELADHLKVNSKLIKMTKLLAKPTYKDTSIGPGETATSETTNSSCKIGAFVEVEGMGNHALMSGHGKSPGDVLLYPNGDRLGTVNVSLHPPLQSTTNETWCSYYSDVALVRLQDQDRFISRVTDEIQGSLGLTEQPIYATNNMLVRLFNKNGRKGKIDSANYIICDYTYNIEFRLMSVVSESGGPIHDEGESGILIATQTPVNGRVSAVGILVRLETMLEDNEERTARQTSLAVPLQANFDALLNDSYCKGASGSIKFLS